MLCSGLRGHHDGDEKRWAMGGLDVPKVAWASYHIKEASSDKKVELR
jgi:hypothetical protein